MKKKTIIISYLFLLIISCKRENKNETFFVESELGRIIESFILDNPLNVPPKIKDLKEWSYPSYHVHFYEEKNDTLMDIFQTPFLLEFLKKEWETKNESEYSALKPDVLIFHNRKNPIFLFGLKSYYNDINFTETLSKEIPDSLKFNGMNYHLKPEQQKRVKYKVKNGVLIKINGI